MRPIKINGNLRKIPSSIEELSKQQYLIAAEIVMNYKELDTRLIQIELAKTVLDLPDSYYDAWKADCMRVYGEESGPTVFYEELEDVVIGVTDFFFEYDEEENMTFNTGFTHNYFPVIKHKKKKFFGPSHKLMNITIYELAVLFTTYDQYIKEETPGHLHKILATMYRPAKPATHKNIMSSYEGDIRLPLRKHERTMDKREEVFANLDNKVKDHILFYFACSRNHIEKTFPHVFSSTGSGKKMTHGWPQVIWELAGELSNEDAIADKNAYSTLAYLNYLIQKNG